MYYTNYLALILALALEHKLCVLYIKSQSQETDRWLWSNASPPIKDLYAKIMLEKRKKPAASWQVLLVFYEWRMKLRFYRP